MGADSVLRETSLAGERTGCAASSLGAVEAKVPASGYVICLIPPTRPLQKPGRTIGVKPTPKSASECSELREAQPWSLAGPNALDGEAGLATTFPPFTIKVRQALPSQNLANYLWQSWEAGSVFPSPSG